MNVPSKAKMDLIERAARAAFPDFECLDVRGGEVFLCKKYGVDERFNPLENLVDALSLANSLSMEFSGYGGVWASASTVVANKKISVLCGADDDLVKYHSCPPICAAITRCAEKVWELKKRKQSQ